jgi:hypothetical protein
MIDSNYPALSRAIADSILWRTSRSLVRMFTRAWPNSSTARLMAAASPLPGLRQIAWIAVFAATAALAAQFTMPVYVRSGLPVMWPLTAITLMVIVAVSANAFERAWPHSVVARVLTPRRLR